MPPALAAASEVGNSASKPSPKITAMSGCCCCCRCSWPAHVHAQPGALSCQHLGTGRRAGHKQVRQWGCWGDVGSTCNTAYLRIVHCCYCCVVLVAGIVISGHRMHVQICCWLGLLPLPRLCVQQISMLHTITVSAVSIVDAEAWHSTCTRSQLQYRGNL
jgi:hypothetical protein